MLQIAHSEILRPREVRSGTRASDHQPCHHPCPPSPPLPTPVVILGKTQEYAEEEVAAFLDDPERSTDYMMQFAFAEVRVQ